MTQLRSLAEDRTALFDFAAAGPFAGGAVAAALFLVGLAMSGGGGEEVQRRQRSSRSPRRCSRARCCWAGSRRRSWAAAARFGVGGVGRFRRRRRRQGRGRRRHPCPPPARRGLGRPGHHGFNLLPVGRLDGGRMVQAAFGRTPLAATSFFAYVGLALGFLGSALALPFGLYVLICQRDPENSPRDGVTEPSAGEAAGRGGRDRRGAAGAAAGGAGRRRGRPRRRWDFPLRGKYSCFFFLEQREASTSFLFRFSFQRGKERTERESFNER